jgi:hypothetical protein
MGGEMVYEVNCYKDAIKNSSGDYIAVIQDSWEHENEDTASIFEYSCTCDKCGSKFLSNYKNKKLCDSCRKTILHVSYKKYLEIKKQREEEDIKRIRREMLDERQKQASKALKEGNLGLAQDILKGKPIVAEATPIRHCKRCNAIIKLEDLKGQLVPGQLWKLDYCCKECYFGPDQQVYPDGRKVRVAKQATGVKVHAAVLTSTKPKLVSALQW